MMKMALLPVLSFNSLSQTCLGLDCCTQVGLLTEHMRQVRECPVNPVSLPDSFYGVLEEAFSTLSQPCKGGECQAWATNGNGKRLPDPVLYMLRTDIDTFHQQKNLDLFQWNVFFFRLATHLSIYPQRGYHPITELLQDSES